MTHGRLITETAILITGFSPVVAAVLSERNTRRRRHRQTLADRRAIEAGQIERWGRPLRDIRDLDRAS